MKKMLKTLIVLTLLASMLMALLPTGASAWVMTSDLRRHSVTMYFDGYEDTIYYIIDYYGIRHGPYTSREMAIAVETYYQNLMKLANQKPNITPLDTTKGNGSAAYAGK